MQLLLHSLCVVLCTYCLVCTDVIELTAALINTVQPSGTYLVLRYYYYDTLINVPVLAVPDEQELTYQAMLLQLVVFVHC